MQEVPRPGSRELRLLGLCWIFLLRNQRRPAAPPLPPANSLLQLRALLEASPRPGREDRVVAARNGAGRGGKREAAGADGEEEEAAREAGEEGQENECCVCYEPRARLRHCRFCDARLSVCLSCLRSWKKSGGGRAGSAEEQCILCGGPRGSRRSIAGRRPARISAQQAEEEEQWLTLYFLLFTFLQYLYLIWFVRNVLVQLVQLSIFDL